MTPPSTPTAQLANPPEIGYLMCGTDCHEHPTVFTRGVREHVVAGHIGTCSNTQTQSMTNVLAEPIIIVTSPTTTTAVHVHPDTPTSRSPTETHHQQPTPLLTAARDQPHANGGAK